MSWVWTSPRPSGVLPAAGLYRQPQAPLPTLEGGLGARILLPLNALELASDLDPSLSCAQIWADPGKYALMGAAAQLGEFPMAQCWLG